jgi:hypothetical protein
VPAKNYLTPELKKKLQKALKEEENSEIFLCVNFIYS